MNLAMTLVSCSFSSMSSDTRHWAQSFPWSQSWLTWFSLFSLQIENMVKTLYVLYFISIITLLLNILGLYGAIKEKQWVLILVGKGKSVVLLIVAIPVKSETFSRIWLLMPTCVCLSLQLEWSLSVCSWLLLKFQHWLFDHRYYKKDFKTSCFISIFWDISFWHTTNFHINGVHQHKQEKVLSCLYGDSRSTFEYCQTAAKIG